MCCNLSSLQSDLYTRICQSKEVKALLKSGSGGGCTVLSSITALKKLCNHPKVRFIALLQVIVFPSLIGLFLSLAYAASIFPF